MKTKSSAWSRKLWPRTSDGLSRCTLLRPKTTETQAQARIVLHQLHPIQQLVIFLACPGPGSYEEYSIFTIAQVCSQPHQKRGFDHCEVAVGIHNLTNFIFMAQWLFEAFKNRAALNVDVVKR
jgi:hypothetical protein